MYLIKIIIDKVFKIKSRIHFSFMKKKLTFKNGAKIAEFEIKILNWLPNDKKLRKIKHCNLFIFHKKEEEKINQFC